MSKQMTPTFRSFFQGGFECATLALPGRPRLDLLRTTGHARYAEEDFQALTQLGIRTARDGLRWHLIETIAGHYDWSSFLSQLRAADATGMQVIWDLCHYGWPDHVDIWSPSFPSRFAAFAAEVARIVRDTSEALPLYCPINEISFWAWAGGDMGSIGPCATGRGDELKRQLARASLKAIAAIRNIDGRARFVLVDPVFRVKPRRTDEERYARETTASQYHGWDMLLGKMHPEFGGSTDVLDVMGVNYYPHNQWFADGQTIRHDEAAYTDFKQILIEVHQRYQRPILVAETGAEGEHRAPWLRYVCDQVAQAIAAGVPVKGICLYPITDYPGWQNDRHCPTGLLGFPDELGRRPVDRETALELAAQQDRFARLMALQAAGPSLEAL